MIRNILFLLFTALLSHTSAMSQNMPCRFDEVTLAFAGTSAEQVRCLSRPNAIGGVLGAELVFAAVCTDRDISLLLVNFLAAVAHSMHQR